MGSQKSRVVGFLAASTFIVVVAVGLGLYVGGSPSTARRVRLDEQRTNDLRQIYSAVEQYYNVEARYTLPPTLETLRIEPTSYVTSILDPQSRQPYTYEATGPESYKLCANFETEASNNSMNEPFPVFARPGGPLLKQPNFSNHRIGENCFEANVQRWPTS